MNFCLQLVGLQIPQGHPKNAQDNPKTPQRHPKDASKLSQRGPKTSQRQDDTRPDKTTRFLMASEIIFAVFPCMSSRTQKRSICIIYRILRGKTHAANKSSFDFHITSRSQLYSKTYLQINRKIDKFRTEIMQNGVQRIVKKCVIALFE